MNYSIDYGRANIKFKVNRRKRKTLGINVLPSGKVTVDAPEEASVKKVKEIVSNRANWILKQKKEVLSFPSPLNPKQYLAGETFWYLGRQYRLSIFEADKDEVILTRNYLEVHTRLGNQPKNIKKQINKWFYEKSKSIFFERLNFCMKKVKKLEIISLPIIKLRKMKNRWGSCTHNNFIILNTELIVAPVDCIDYVIIHELCHLKEHNHSQKFYQLMTLVLPNWKACKVKLNKVELHKWEA